MGSTRPLVGVTALSLLAVIAAVLAGCGSDGDADQLSGGGEGGSGKSVTISDYTYEPATITVAKGATVTFANRDSTPHTATSKAAGEFESGSIDAGKSGEVTLEESGTFAYYCLFHPFMKGTIEVT